MTAFSLSWRKIRILSRLSAREPIRVGTIRESELLRALEKRSKTGLREIILALSATSEGENTTDHLRQLLLPYRSQVKLSVLGRGLSTGSELEYSDAETLSGALQNRKET
jgi:recombination protein RecR